MAQVIDMHRDWEVNERRIVNGEEVKVGFHVYDIGWGISIDKTGTFFGKARTLTETGDLRDGVVAGDTITFYIDWPGGKTGLYRGFWYADGYLRGHTVNVASPGENAEWWSIQNDFRMIEV